MAGNILECPVRALGRRVENMKYNRAKESSLLPTYNDSLGHGDVTNGQISFAVKRAATAINYKRREIPIDNINSHYLHVGGACALQIVGYADQTIKKMGSGLQSLRPSTSIFVLRC